MAQTRGDAQRESLDHLMGDPRLTWYWAYPFGRSFTRAVGPRRHAWVLRRDPICRYCHEAESVRVDHVIPLCRGGDNSLANLVGACLPCDDRKGYLVPMELGWDDPRPPEVARHDLLRRITSR